MNLCTGLLQALKVEAPRISRQSARESGKVVSLRTRRLYPPGNIARTHFC
jgi:hypothetical protein